MNVMLFHLVLNCSDFSTHGYILRAIGRTLNVDLELFFWNEKKFVWKKLSLQKKSNIKGGRNVFKLAQGETEERK